MWRITWAAAGSESISDGKYTISSSDSTVSIANYGMYVGSSNAVAGSWSVQWARMRAYPPNGVMPSANVGNQAFVNSVNGTGILPRNKYDNERDIHSNLRLYTFK